MRRLPLLLASLLLAACPSENRSDPAPTDRFFFPTGLVHLPGTAGQGWLVVASSSFDRSFDSGSLLSVNLDTLGLPAFGEPAREPVPAFEDLGVDPARSAVALQSLAGAMDFWPNPDGSFRLFVPTRDEGDLLHVVDFREGALSCRGSQGRDCREGALSLTDDVAGASGDKPRAPAPIEVAVSRSAAGNNNEVWLTHVGAADAPLGSGNELETYVVRLDAADPQVSAERFISMDPDDPDPNAPGGTEDVGGTQSVALGSQHAYVTGRRFATEQGGLRDPEFLLRRVGRDAAAGVQDIVPLNTDGAGELYRALEARGVALSPDESRLYVATRVPDTLVVFDITDPTGPSPTLTLVRSVPLPDGASQVRVLERPGRGPLVAVACTFAGVVALYDDDVGDVQARVVVGGRDEARPFSLAVAPQAPLGARLFVSNFGDGRVSVIDIPDLGQPQQARLVAFVGRQQVTRQASAEE